MIMRNIEDEGKVSMLFPLFVILDVLYEAVLKYYCDQILKQLISMAFFLETEIEPSI